MVTKNEYLQQLYLKKPEQVLSLDIFSISENTHLNSQVRNKMLESYIK